MISQNHFWGKGTMGWVRYLGDPSSEVQQLTETERVDKRLGRPGRNGVEILRNSQLLERFVFQKLGIFEVMIFAHIFGSSIGDMKLTCVFTHHSWFTVCPPSCR